MQIQIAPYFPRCIYINNQLIIPNIFEVDHFYLCRTGELLFSLFLPSFLPLLCFFSRRSFLRCSSLLALCLRLLRSEESELLLLLDEEEEEEELELELLLRYFFFLLGQSRDLADFPLAAFSLPLPSFSFSSLTRVDDLDRFPGQNLAMCPGLLHSQQLPLMLAPLGLLPLLLVEFCFSTLIFLPSMVLPLRAAITRSTSPASSISMKEKQQDWLKLHLVSTEITLHSVSKSSLSFWLSLEGASSPSRLVTKILLLGEREEAGLRDLEWERRARLGADELLLLLLLGINYQDVIEMAVFPIIDLYKWVASISNKSLRNTSAFLPGRLPLPLTGGCLILYSEMKESSTRNIKIIYRGSTSADKQSRTWRIDDDRKSSADRHHDQAAQNLQSRLDYRDEMLHFPWFAINKEVYLGNPMAYEEEMLEWLVNVVENTFSITFRHLLEEKLTVEEGKAFACKNILLNIKDFCEYLHGEVGAPVDQNFLKQLDLSLSEIISIVINKYPQNNAKSATKKILKFIKQISNRQNDQYDFLLTHGISIKYRTNGDYSTEIMTVVNAILNTPTEDVREDEAIMENFRKFCRQLFYFAREERPDLSGGPTFKIIDDSIDAIIGESNKTSVEQLDDLNNHKDKAESFRDVAASLIAENYEVTEDLLNFQKVRGHLYKIGQKIPSQVKQFSEKEMREGQFKVYHSSVLRVLTKWSQQLYEKLQRADQLIRSRIHKFKTNSQTLRFCSVEEKEYLYQQALKEKLRVDEYLQTLKDENKILQSAFAAECVSGKFIKKFTNVGVFAGKLEELVTNYTFRYLNRLIHSLLSVSVSAGEKLYEYYKYLEDQEEVAEQCLKDLGDINLVTFKVGDLLRAKYTCDQHEFVSTLGILYKLEQIDSSFLRIVKIKNRMFLKDNDILINLFFKGRAICELQLSIHRQENKKEKMYGEFNHFIYQLKRSQFGIISQFSSIIAQHDPIVNYFTFCQHQPPVLIQRSKKHTLHLRSRSKELLFRRKISDGTFLNHKLYEKAIQRPFICERCKNLKTVLNPKFYYREQNDLYCNDCIEQFLYKQPETYYNILAELFKYYILDDRLSAFLEEVTLWNPREGLKTIRDQKQLYVDFIDYGFAIEKGDKIPKVRFFKTFYNPMNNEVVLSSMINGDIDNFLHLNCKKEKGKYLFFGILEKYLFFSLRSNVEETMIKLAETCVSEQNCESDLVNTIHIKQKQFLKKEYIRTILNSFQKYHSTLYLNGYKYIMEYLYEYLHGSNEVKTSKRRTYFSSNTHRITSVLLQSSEIFTLYPFITYFANTREINLSNNHIKSIQILQSFKLLQSVNISRNHIDTIEPLTKMPWLETIIAKGNQISALPEINQIKCLRVLDCSENRISFIRELEGLFNLQQLLLAKNLIEKMQGIAHLYKLRVLNLSENGISKLEWVFDLKLLEVLDISSNYLSEMVPLQNLQHLSTLNLNKNIIKVIVELRTNSIKELNLADNVIVKMENLGNLTELILLNLASNQIEVVEGLESLEKLKRLILSNNNIKSIENVEVLKGLEYLRMENNPICAIGNTDALKSLIALYFQYCDLKEINRISSLKKLKSLTLAHNSIPKIDNIDELVRLQKLDLSFNKIQKIENLGTLKYLQTLSLSGNRIAKLQNLEQLLELNWLIVSNNNLTRIEGLENLTELRILDLDENQIEEVKGLENLIDLQELLLSGNKIKRISGLDTLANLKKLSLAKNQISSIQGLEQLCRLQLLDLQMNSISKIQNLDFLSQLKWLVLSINQISKIQGMDKLQQLSKLILSHNAISVLENITPLKVLSVLFLDHNQIKKIEGLEEMQNLQKLNLGFNRISKMEGLEKLQMLNELNLQSNKIASIQGISQLLKLKKIVLTKNGLKAVSNIQTLKELSYLDVSKNEIVEISNIHNLPYLEFINLADNPVNDIEAYTQLNDHVKLCIQLIMHKFDSQNMRRTVHQHSSLPSPTPVVDTAIYSLTDSQGGEEVENKLKLVRSFARSFSPQF